MYPYIVYTVMRFFSQEDYSPTC